MKNKIIIIAVTLSMVLTVSCMKDLDLIPKDPNTVMSGNVSDNPEYIRQYLAKIYASFLISGQDGGSPDIAASDPNFFTTMRAFWNLQELPTDEAMCAWGDVGIADLNTQTWSASNPFLTALYQRLGLSITFANDFIKMTAGNSDEKIARYNAEARFLRALAYYWYLDLLGNPPFTTEKDGVGSFFPRQLDENFNTGRKMLFNYIASELKAIETLLGDPGFQYPQADKAAAWMLLARLYLNAEVYTGTAKWDSCIIYTNRVINSGKYSLASDYRKNFCADNDGPSNSEMIFSWAHDGHNTNGWVGTTFIIQSCSDPVYLPSEVFHGLTDNPNWNGNRARIQFLDIMIDTIATYGNNPVPWDDDPFFEASNDNRVYLRVKKSPYIPSPGSSGDYGIGVYKFTAKLSDGTFPASFNISFANTDFPVFRYADALLMRAEANFRLNNPDDAVTDINLIRERAFGNTSGNITTAELNEKFLLDERAREFYYEAHRRTDLIRFGQFTDGSYTWAWKGGVMEGAQTSNYRNVYPIPAEEIAANPYLKQNPSY
ncbi:MAG: RagB/SusD family nutrient uptake outer membrane protein [Rikenellaceae bacterium]|nr:RagB/SusD family nutrient uptake outer membrane protein [Rikenellaceae bacterium]